MAVEYNAETMRYYFNYEIFPGEWYCFEVGDIANTVFYIDCQISRMLRTQKEMAIEDSKI